MNMEDEKKKKEETIEKEEIQKKEEAASNQEAPKQTEVEMVSIPLKDYAEQLEKLDELAKQRDEFSEGWMRERADFANYRKRAARDEEINRQNIRIDILRKYLDIHDDIELAIKHMPDNIKNDGWVDGIFLIQQKLANLLKGEGLEPISSEVGSEFDPTMHEAVSHEEHPDLESGKIIETVQQGYKIGDRVVRPSRVRVAK